MSRLQRQGSSVGTGGEQPMINKYTKRCLVSKDRGFAHQRAVPTPSPASPGRESRTCSWSDQSASTIGLTFPRALLRPQICGGRCSRCPRCRWPGHMCGTDLVTQNSDPKLSDWLGRWGKVKQIEGRLWPVVHRLHSGRSSRATGDMAASMAETFIMMAVPLIVSIFLVYGLYKVLAYTLKVSTARRGLSPTNSRVSPPPHKG